jgi:hypothetical protein
MGNLRWGHVFGFSFQVYLAKEGGAISEEEYEIIHRKVGDLGDQLRRELREAAGISWWCFWRYHEVQVDLDTPLTLAVATAFLHLCNHKP